MHTSPVWLLWSCHFTQGVHVACFLEAHTLNRVRHSTTRECMVSISHLKKTSEIVSKLCIGLDYTFFLKEKLQANGHPNNFF